MNNSYILKKNLLNPVRDMCHKHVKISCHQASQEGGTAGTKYQGPCHFGGPSVIWGPINLGHTTLTSSNEQFINPNWGKLFLSLWGQEGLGPPWNFYDGGNNLPFFLSHIKIRSNCGLISNCCLISLKLKML